MYLAQVFLYISILLFLAIVILSGWFLLFRLRHKGRITRALNMSLFLITLPQKTKKEESETRKTEKEIISVMEQLYSTFYSIHEKKDVFIYGQPCLVFEVATPQVGEEICFYLACPRRYESLIEKQIHGFYPQAFIQKTEDYNIFNPEGSVAGSYLKLAKSYVLPIKTYQNLETDPLNETVNTLSKLEEIGEGAAIQIIFKPIKSKWNKAGLKIAKEMQKGTKYDLAKIKANQSKFWKFLGEAGEELFRKEKKDKSAFDEKKIALTPLEQEIIKALEGKSNKIGFTANVRLLVSAKNSHRAEELLSQLESSFNQFGSPVLNSFKICRLRGRLLKRLIYDFSFRIFNKKQSIILNSEELTSLFHLPNSNLETPKVKVLKAEPASPPADLPKDGLILGKNLYRGVETVVRIKENDRRRHLYIIGQTGTGKSVLEGNMIVQDIKANKGVAVLDPHGDLIEDVLCLIPKERAEDVIILDPSDTKRPLGLNMLEYDPAYPEYKTFIVNELINIFDKLYDLKQVGGPMFEQYTRNALLLLMDNAGDGYTLMEVPKVLADKEFRYKLLVKCQNIVVKDFWEKEAEKAGGEAALQNMVPYITSKFNVFIANDFIRPIIGQAKSSINFREIIDTRKILLANLSKGRLGDINSSLLGLIITGKLLMAAFSRVDVAQEARQDFYLYMDEFQNFATETIATILSEARKYRLSLIIAHQFIAQLTDKIREAVFGNVGSMVSFRVGSKDAEFLIKQFEPVFNENDLININNFNAYVKLMINNETSKPFSIMTYPLEKGDWQMIQSIKELSRLKYGRDKEEVEKDILRRWRSSSFTPASSSPAESDMGVK